MIAEMICDEVELFSIKTVDTGVELMTIDCNSRNCSVKCKTPKLASRAGSPDPAESFNSNCCVLKEADPMPVNTLVSDSLTKP